MKKPRIGFLRCLDCCQVDDWSRVFRASMVSAAVTFVIALIIAYLYPIPKLYIIICWVAFGIIFAFSKAFMEWLSWRFAESTVVQSAFRTWRTDRRRERRTENRRADRREQARRLGRIREPFSATSAIEDKPDKPTNRSRLALSYVSQPRSVSPRGFSLLRETISQFRDDIWAKIAPVLGEAEHAGAFPEPQTVSRPLKGLYDRLTWPMNFGTGMPSSHRDENLPQGPGHLSGDSEILPEEGFSRILRPRTPAVSPMNFPRQSPEREPTPVRPPRRRETSQEPSPQILAQQSPGQEQVPVRPPRRQKASQEASRQTPIQEDTWVLAPQPTLDQVQSPPTPPRPLRRSRESSLHVEGLEALEIPGAVPSPRLRSRHLSVSEQVSPDQRLGPHSPQRQQRRLRRQTPPRT